MDKIKIAAEKQAIEIGADFNVWGINGIYITNTESSDIYTF